MKTAHLLLALSAAALAAVPAAAKPKPRWEVGVGGVGSYSPAFYGSDQYSFGAFPIIYFSYRGEDFSFLPNGLYDVAAYDRSEWGIGFSFDSGGDVKSVDRFNLGKIGTVLEAGPEVTVALLANGRSRIEASVAARVVYEWGEDFEGWVLEPKLAYLTTLTNDSRLGLSIAPKFGFDRYNDFFYSGCPTATTCYDAKQGYIGTAVGLQLVYDMTDRMRISGEAKGIIVSGSKIDDSPFVDKDFNYAVRIALTYSIWQSDELVGGD
jgi:outer membrane scaffolding protein for murein synthesis (MipA/OmpV family)